MIITLEIIKTLAHRGAPLDVVVSQTPGNPGNPGGFSILNTDGRSCHVAKDLHDYDLQDLRRALEHYPDIVNINGETLDTRPFPGLAQVSVESFSNMEERSHSNQPVTNIPSHRVAGNAHIAGVICHMDSPSHQHPLVYHTPAGGGNDFWSKTSRVTVEPVWVITTDELEHISTGNSGIPHLIHDSTIRDTIIDRASDQVNRTLDLPELPERHKGLVHDYLLEPDIDPTYVFGKGIPIIIHGTPVSLDDDFDRALAVSIAQTLYSANQKYVPVSNHHNDHSKEHCYHPLLSGASFTKTPDQHQSNWAMDKADSITMEFTMEEHDDQSDQTLSLPAPFLLEGHSRAIQASYVPSEVSAESLSRAMVLAYWIEDEDASWNDTKEKLNDIQQRMWTLASAALRRP